MAKISGRHVSTTFKLTLATHCEQRGMLSLAVLVALGFQLELVCSKMLHNLLFCSFNSQS
jgi:hypothetical protein